MMPKRSTTDETNQASDPEVWVGRLRTFVNVFGKMGDENERSAALYYLIARHYGNEVGEHVLAVIKSARV
jgi:hypothetical protein